ncbi:MAG: stage II sporulation protein R [Bacillota bacterium]
MRRIRLILITVAALVILIGFAAQTAVELTPTSSRDSYNPDNLLRLHVIANSNSLTDQRLKRNIRDQIIQETEGLFSDLSNAQKAQEVVEDNLDYIRQVVKDKLEEQGRDYQVQLKLGNFDFPKRTYGNLTLPAGNYQALRVVLGSGRGQNWWCVLFPPFCYIDAVDQQKDQSTNKAKSEEVEVVVKSKLVEYLQDNSQLADQQQRLKETLRASVVDLNNLVDNLIKE